MTSESLETKTSVSKTIETSIPSKPSFRFKLSLYCLIAFFATGSILTVLLSCFLKNGVERDMLIAAFWLVLFFGMLVLFLLMNGSVQKLTGILQLQKKELIESKNRQEEAYRKLNHSYRETVAAASAAIDARDAYTAGHSRRVADIACRIGKELGLEESALECLELAALLHDIGKIGVPDYILNKPGKLSREEFEKIMEHPVLGFRILENIEFLSPMLSAILYHHERPDGKGYPKGLKEADIPIGATIIAIADTYDAMTSDRPYRKALTHEDAIRELVRNRGTQFKKEVVDAFLMHFESGIE